MANFEDFDDAFVACDCPIAVFGGEGLEFCFGGVDAFYLVQIGGVYGCGEEFDEDGIGVWRVGKRV
jgi:hypothetical protein